MTGEELVSLMQDRAMSRSVYRAARRYTKCPEDIEEYMDDAWMRIANCDNGKTHEYYIAAARRAVNAARMRQRYHVQKKHADNLHGISESHTQEKPPRNAIELGRGRYLKLKPERLSQWYYDGEWMDHGIDRDGFQVRTFYEIVVIER